MTEETERQETREEFGIFVERLMHFISLWTVYSDILTQRYIPSHGKALVDAETTAREWPVGLTLMLLLYAYFYSLIEDSEGGMNGLRLWRQRHPEEIRAIEAVEAPVAPFIGSLQLFRNRLGFHGSRTRAHESRGFELFKEHSGNDIFEAMKNFKALGAALIEKENVQRGISPYNREAVRQLIDQIAERAQSQ